MISVIVPVYKVEPYLNQCVESILCQIYSDLEILLIDDGSPDRCGQICDEYEKQDCRVKVFHTENHGLSAARNVGLQNAEGEYIGFVDSDDWIESEMYEVLLKKIEETESDVCICDFYQESGIFGKNFQPDKVVYQDTDAIKALLDRKINYNVWNKLYRREVFQDITFPEGKNFEDIAIMHRIMYEAGRVAVIPDLGYHYRIRLESITRNYSARNLIDHADAYLNSYVYLSGLQKQSFPINQHDLLSLPARGISIVWRWWYQCSIEEKAEYEDRIGELLDFTREYLPLFGFSSWPNYLRLSSLFMHSDSGVSFAVLYTFNQLFRRLWPRKGNVVRELRQKMPSAKKLFFKMCPRSMVKTAVNVVNRGRLIRGQLETALSPPKAKHFCPCCGSKSKTFVAGSYADYPERFNPVRYENTKQDVLCPVCRSLPRHRILASWCDNHKELVQKADDILYFAPEYSMTLWLRRNRVSYKTADLYKEADLKLDIQATGLPDESYDMIICNHVLEHVDDFRAALKEMYRILRPRGSFICSFPMDPKVEFIDEDPSVQTPEERFRRFGQDDHKRVFGMKANQLLTATGFSVEIINGADYPEKIMPVVGLADYDMNILFRCVKPTK